MDEWMSIDHSQEYLESFLVRTEVAAHVARLGEK